MIMMADESEGNTVGEELEPDHPETSSSTSTSSSQVSDASLQHILQKTSSIIDIQRQLVVSKVLRSDAGRPGNMMFSLL